MSNGKLIKLIGHVAFLKSSLEPRVELLPGNSLLLVAEHERLEGRLFDALVVICANLSDFVVHCTKYDTDVPEFIIITDAPCSLSQKQLFFFVQLVVHNWYL